MALLLIKMAVQCIDFSMYSPSVLVISSLYAATAFVKHSKTFSSEQTNHFCSFVREQLINILEDDFDHQQINLSKEMCTEEYLEQLCPEFVEHIAMDLVDFFKVFDEWHCGLNQLKKFNSLPFV